MDSTTVSASAGVQELDGRLWGASRTYKARFDADGVEFTPAFGPSAPRNHPLTLHAESVGRGEAVIPLPTCAPKHEGLRIVYDRGLTKECYDVGVDRLEQSFVFDALPPGKGDLVVRCRVATDLAVSADGEGLRFELPEVGHFRMGAVVGFDAKGERAAGRVRYREGQLELSLPEAFLDHASLPITLDPPIGSVISISTPGAISSRGPEVAYDDASGVYLIVWTQVVSASDWDVIGQRVSPAGALVGPQLLIEVSSALESEPHVADCTGRRAFVVACTKNGDIVGRAIPAASGLPLPLATIAGGASNQHLPSLSTSIGNDFVVGLWQSDGDGALQATQVVINSTGQLVTGPVRTFATGATAPATNPHLAASDGGTGRHALVFQRDFAGGVNSDPVMLVVDSTGNPITPEHVLENSAADDEIPTIDGDGTTWIAAWQRNVTASDQDSYARSVSFDPRTPGLLFDNGTSRAVSAARGRYEKLPFVIAHHDLDLVGVQLQITSGQPQSSATVFSLDPFQCSQCEHGLGYAFPFPYNGSMHGCSVASGGGTGDDMLLSYETLVRPGSAGDIVAVRWRPTDGVAASFGPGCGAGGTNHATCGVTPNPAFAHRLRGSLPNAPTLFVLSSNRLSFTCGACTLVPDPLTGILLAIATDSHGSALIPAPIPDARNLLGVPLITQWATLNATSPACALFHIDLSNALQVVIELTPP